MARSLYLFRSRSDADLRAITDAEDASRLPAGEGPWILERRLDADEPWTLEVNRPVVEFGVGENGFYLWGSSRERNPPKPIIESDRVEGTAVYDQQGHQIGTIKRLLIEKVSGKVIYVDLTFGGFLGVGVHHRTVPWETLTYDRGLHGYRTDITEEQVRNAPNFYGDDEVWPEREREKEMRDYWRDWPRGPI